MDSPRQVKESAKQLSPMVWLAIIAGVLIVGFFAGMQYLKSSNSQDDKTTAGSMQGGGPQTLGGGPGGPGGGEPCANGEPKSMMMLSGQKMETCGMPDSGTVTTVGDDSVTITLGSGESKTFTVADDTQVLTKDGAGTLAGIVVDDTLLIVASDTNDSQARYIVVNPPEPGTTW